MKKKLRNNKKVLRGKEAWVYLLLVACGCLSQRIDSFAQTRVNFTIQGEKPRKTISPYVYGTNDTYPQAGARRLGGNRITSYNWENNASNAGSDWIHHSDDYVPWQQGVPDAEYNSPGAALRSFHQRSLSQNAYSLVTLPMAGYVARDKNGTVSEGQIAPSNRWDAVKYRKSGPLSLTPDPADGTVYVDEEINYLLHHFGRSNTTTGVKGYALDNEPGLWFDTHSRLRNSEPVRVKYLMDNSFALATRIKEMDPTAEVFGPASWGVTEFENLQFAPDWEQERGAHTTFLDLYLDRMRQRGQQSGQRLLDVLALHWYPQGNQDGVNPFGNGTDYATNARRMAMTRSLWDPTYIENTWIGNDPFKVQQFLPFVPKIQQHISQYYPGTKLAITEYSYMGLGHASGGIAQADALGIFGTQGVYLATYWGEVSNYIKAGFDLYRNYDGEGGRFGDTSLEAGTSDISNTSVFASIHGSSDEKLHVIAMSKNQDGPTTATFTVTGTRQYKSARVWGFDAGSSTLKPLKSVRVIHNNTFEYTLPPLTACHLVLSEEDLAIQPEIVEATVTPSVGYSDGTANFTLTSTIHDSDNNLTQVVADLSAFGGGKAVAFTPVANVAGRYSLSVQVPAGTPSGLKSIRFIATDATGHSATGAVDYRVLARTTPLVIWDGDQMSRGKGQAFYDERDAAAQRARIEKADAGGNQAPGSLRMHFEHGHNLYNVLTWRLSDNDNPADARDISDYGTLEFYLKSNAPNNADLEVSLRDATGGLNVSNSVYLKQGGYLGSLNSSGYTRVRIPLSAFSEGSWVDLKAIWQLNFSCNTAPQGFDAWIDDVRVLPYSHPVLQPVVQEASISPDRGYADGKTPVTISARVEDPDNNLQTVVVDLAPLGLPNNQVMTLQEGRYAATVTLPPGSTPGEKQLNMLATDAEGNTGHAAVRFTVNEAASTLVLWDGDVVNTGKPTPVNKVTTCVVDNENGHNAPKSMKMHFDMADNGFAAVVWDWNENTGDAFIRDLSQKGYLSFYVKVQDPSERFDIEVFLKDRTGASTSPIAVRKNGYLATFTNGYQLVRIPLAVLWSKDQIDRKQVTRVGFLSTGLDKPYDFWVDDIVAGGSDVLDCETGGIQAVIVPANTTLDLTVTGGSGQYQYQWSNGATKEDLTGVTPGTYSVQIMDAITGCITSATATVEETETCEKTVIQGQVTVENGKGYIDLQVSGGSGIYGYLWTGGSEYMNLWEIPDGTYEVIVTDLATQCQAKASFTIVIPDIELTTANPACAPNGSIAVTTIKGSPGNNRFYIDGQPNPAGLGMARFDSLVPGQYHIRVEGDGGFSVEKEVTLEGSGEAPLVRGDVSYTSGKGYVNLYVAGGSGIYTYEWSNGATTLNIWEVPPGTYWVLVTDLVSGCTTTYSTKIEGDQESIMIYPNPAVGQESVWIKFNFVDYGIRRLVLTDHMGQVVYTTDVSEWAQDLTLPVGNLRAGKYQVTLEGRKLISTHLVIQ